MGTKRIIAERAPMYCALQVLALVFILAIIPLPAVSQSSAPVGVKLVKPGFLTSVGQNSDAAVMKVLLNTRLKLGLEYDISANAASLGETKTLVLVIGASNKGLGAAGLSLEQEIARTKILIAAAREKGIAILSLHTGGSARRGDSSNALIKLCIPASSYVVVVAEGNKDKFFNEVCAQYKIPLIEVNSLAEAGTAVKNLFQE